MTFFSRIFNLERRCSP